MKLIAGIMAAISVFAAALSLNAAEERDGWYVYWGDNMILGGPYQTEATCKAAMRTNRHVPSDAICEVIVYRNGIPVSGTQADLNHGTPHP